MSDEKRPEEAAGGDQPNDSAGGGSTRQQQQAADMHRGGTGGSGGLGGGRHGARRRHRGGERESQPASRRTDTSINMDELRELADLITAQGFTEFEIEKEGFRLRLSRNTYQQASPPTGSATGSVIPFPTPPTASATATPNATAGAHAASSAASAAVLADAPNAVEDLFKITSPIVGTFYRAPSPTSDVFVKQGSRVEPETVVCIIEAMKLMNEIQAEVTGTIEKIYVENGQPVEYGQALFGIRK
ncbi:MAG TPA: acetyl-CoA carboxylase biotin carboxyl carrier protein [Pyrinomonadaceae bacterium]|nr:acetyl-CoA carboxylase biotin carboxyl carrier protein [Pyrinomonadaceae bacterium]